MRITTALIVTAFFGTAQPVAGDVFTISQWALGTTVYDSSIGGPNGKDTDYNNVVENPLRLTQFATIGISTAESVYAFDWTADAGSFLIEAAHQAEDIDDGTLVSRSTGYIWVEAAVDLRLEISAAYDYYLPPGMMLAGLYITALDADTYEEIFYSRQRVDSYDGYPASGTLNIDGNAVLSAGHTTVLHYEMIIQSFSGQTGLLGTGNGYIDFQITPEPSTASLLLLAALPLAKSRRRR